MNQNIMEVTEELLKSIPDDELESTLFGFILEKRLKDKFDKQYEVISNLPIGLKYLYVTYSLEGEVDNGGFNQYFYNTCGVFIDEAISAYKYFSLEGIASIVENAAQIAIEEIDLHIKAKKAGTLEAFSESYKYSNLSETDEAFYEHESIISDVRIKMIRNNYKDFIS